MSNQQKMLPTVSVLVVAFIGLLGLFTASRQPSFEAVPAVLVLQLVASGMCFGAVLGAIVMRFRIRKPN
jgi:ribose/xylose/arabinose/galactoside ABC-type transport system permease subunit